MLFQFKKGDFLLVREGGPKRTIEILTEVNLDNWIPEVESRTDLRVLLVKWDSVYLLEWIAPECGIVSFVANDLVRR